MVRIHHPSPFMQNIGPALLFLGKILDTNMQNEWGTYNRFCPRCYARYGHPVVHCKDCGFTTINYKDMPRPITWREWVNHGVTPENKLLRLDIFVYKFLYFKDDGKKFGLTFTKHYDEVTMELLNFV